MKRAFAFVAVTAWVVVLILLHSAIKDFLWIHPWWHGFLAAVPGISVPILAFFELRHSAEANALGARANELQEQNANLVATLDAERNDHLLQIAMNTERQATQAQRNARTLRKYLNAYVVVQEGDNHWSFTPEIVEVSEDDTVTLFKPHGNTSRASCIGVRCDKLVITEIPQGSCPLRLDVLERYGNTIELGEITRWEDRFQPAAIPTFDKGGVARYATYSKSGSAEKRTIGVYTSRDGSNSYLLEASTGERLVKDNIEISRQFMLLQVDYEAAGFTRTGFSTGESTHTMYIH